MKKFLLALFVLVVAKFSIAQNVVYDENAEIRNVSPFNGVEVSGTISLYLSQGDTQGVAVSAGDAKYNYKIKTEVKNGILHISVDGGVWNGFNWANKKLRAYVTVVHLNRLEASGATHVSFTDKIMCDNLHLEISGASELKGELQAANLMMDINGASVARLSGKAGNAKIDASGASVLNGYGLEADTCKAGTSGASGVKIFVKNQLIADASGGSFIFYKGTPSATNLNSSGGSSIKNKNAAE